jgi:mannose-6-phosphate isomerase-like protein (cupin superfamily)
MPTFPLAIPFPVPDEHDKRLLESSGMRSGYVSLAPGEAVGQHTTGDCEELLVPLSGSGELRIPGQPVLTVAPGRVLYNPPRTGHDVVNTGSEPLVYIYVVASPCSG